MELGGLTETIIGCAMKVHGTPGPGFLESVYQNALTHEIVKAGLTVECDRRLQVKYDEVVVGDFIADMLIQGSVLIENKAVQSLAQAHEVPLVNYLTTTGIQIGLLLYFGSSSLQVKRKYRTYRPRPQNNPVNPVNPV